jgi:hypothetical protein
VGAGESERRGGVGGGGGGERTGGRAQGWRKGFSERAGMAGWGGASVKERAPGGGSATALPTA